MKLNGRLLAIARKLPACNVLADIGTDHGYIPIYAVKNNICKKAIASDLREGPLKVALKNIKRNSVAKDIELRQGNGLEKILPGECDLIVIAGMGGSLIRDILSVGIDKAKGAEMLVLQPNTALHILRKWLCENGFDILDETLSFDMGKYYCILSVKWTGVSNKLADEDYYLGQRLFSSKDPLLNEYLEKKLIELNVIINGRAKSNKEKADVRDSDSEIDTATCARIRGRIIKHLEKSMSDRT